MRIAEIMSPHPVIVAPDVDLDDALQLMDDQDVRHLPVMDGARLMGVVSDRDLLGVLGWVPARTPAARQAHRRPGRPQRVADIMHRHVTTAAPGDRVATAAGELLMQRIGCVPVLDDGVLVGIVTEMDVLAAFHRHKHDEHSDPPVERLMTPYPSTIDPQTTFEEASALCSDLKARHLPVLEDGRLVGLLSDRDLRAAAGQGEPAETPVQRLMSTELVTLEADDLSSRAAELMVANRFSSVPVVSNGRLAGIVTLTDLLEHALAVLDGSSRTTRS